MTTEVTTTAEFITNKICQALKNDGILCVDDMCSPYREDWRVLDETYIYQKIVEVIDGLR